MGLSQTEQEMLAFWRTRLTEAAAPRAIPAWHEPWCLNPTDGQCFYCGAREDEDKVESRPQPPTVLAGIEAARQRLKLIEEALSVGHDSYDLASALLPYELAAYADHPDYKEVWRP